MKITKEWLVEKGYEILSFDPEWMVAFVSNADTVEIFTKCLIDENDEGKFITLLHDEINMIYKAINDGY
ncbi:MAG TPA: hypothetical protein DGK91_10965 [Clostridium sp.]|nr:hypothetical protein [Clostridium sp.]HHU98106.1 hypothetical protein [Petrimonas sp.]